MANNSEVAKARLGRVGVWLGALALASAAAERVAAQRIEALGYPALWIGESASNKEALSHAGVLLAATESLVVATGIAGIYSRDPIAANAGALTLGEAYPGRFVLGLGVSHLPLVQARGQDYGKPLRAMRTYLDGIDAAAYRAPLPAEPVPVLLAALRDRMLALSGERTAGAHPYFVPVAHTAHARELLGDGPVLAPELAVVLETDPERARASARSHTEHYLELDNYRNSLLALGYDEADLDDAGSDRLVDDVVAWGDEAAIAARVRAHLDAGADHVCLQPVGVDLDGAVGVLERLAPLLLGT
jgi:probable F420-dependent oxidoreductase